MDENIKQYIDKSALVAEIERIRTEEMSFFKDCCEDELENSSSPAVYTRMEMLLSFIDTLEVKEVDLNNSIQLTWEDMRELYIIFVEVDTEIEFCKCDIQIGTIGYYQEVLKRFKARKGE